MYPWWCTMVVYPWGYTTRVPPPWVHPGTTSSAVYRYPRRERCGAVVRGARVRGPGYPGGAQGMPRDEACRGRASPRGRGTRPRGVARRGVWIALGSNDPRTALWAVRPGSRDPMTPGSWVTGSWVMDPGSQDPWVMDPGSWILGPRIPGSWILGPGSWGQGSQDPRIPWIQDRSGRVSGR